MFDSPAPTRKVTEQQEEPTTGSVDEPWQTVQHRKGSKPQRTAPVGPQPPPPAARGKKKSGWWHRNGVMVNAFGETRPLNAMEELLHRNVTTYGTGMSKKQIPRQDRQLRLSGQPRQTVQKPAQATEDAAKKQEVTSAKRNLSDGSATSQAAQSKFARTDDGGRSQPTPPPSSTSTPQAADYWDTAAVRMSTIRIVRSGSSDGGLTQQDIHYISSEFVSAKHRLLGRNLKLHREVNSARLGTIHGSIRIRLKDMKGISWWQQFISNLKPLTKDGPGYKLLLPGESETTAYRVQIIDPALAGDKVLAGQRFVNEAFHSQECPLLKVDYRVQVHSVNPESGLVTIYLHLVNGQHEQLLREMDYSLQYGIQSYHIVPVRSLRPAAATATAPATAPATEAAKMAAETAAPAATSAAVSADVSIVAQVESGVDNEEQQLLGVGNETIVGEVVDESLLDKSGDTDSAMDDVEEQQQRPMASSSWATEVDLDEATAGVAALNNHNQEPMDVNNVNNDVVVECMNVVNEDGN